MDITACPPLNRQWNRHAFLLLILALIVSSTMAQAWQVDWYTTDGGGEVLSETTDGWQLSGTLGQWDAADSASLTGGPWQLSGGFWGVNRQTDVLFSDGFEG